MTPRVELCQSPLTFRVKGRAPRDVSEKRGTTDHYTYTYVIIYTKYRKHVDCMLGYDTDMMTVEYSRGSDDRSAT